MSIELLDKTYQIPKELSECYDAVEAILAYALSGEGDLQDLISAIASAGSGISAVAEEISHESVYEASGAFAGRCGKLVIEKVVKK